MQWNQNEENPAKIYLLSQNNRAYAVVLDG